MEKRLLKSNVFFKYGIGFFTSALALSSGVACATEGGSTAYNPGSSQFYAGDIPPVKGFYMLSQTNYALSRTMTDGKGRDVPYKFGLKSPTQSFRIIAVPGWRFAGADVFGEVIVTALLGMELDVGDRHGRRYGFGDPIIGGGLSWRSGDYRAVVGIGVGIPVASYDKDRLVNNGGNHWTIQPTFGVGYLDYENPKWEFGLSMRYIHNFENEDTNYTSGNQLMAEYAIGHHFGRLRLGIVGYYLTQLNDDQGPGVGADGNRTKAHAVGPSISWALSPSSRIDVAYQKETWAQNHTKGGALSMGITMKF
jgi:hypothetical protein